MRTVKAPSGIELSASEEALYRLACSDDDAEGLADGDPGEAAAGLWDSLQARKAIPEVRVAWFADPRLNIGGHGRSRRDVFQRNGVFGRDILEHPHFVKYLRYFVEGPDLPAATVAGFVRIVNEDRGSSGEVMSQLQKYARAETRRLRDRLDVAEEFFKLALECGADRFAGAIRRAALSAR